MRFPSRKRFTTLLSATRPQARRRGFTILEVTAVATIIAILSLILVQSLSNRVEEARHIGTQAELVKLSEVMIISFAENNHWFRLQDYDNSSNFPAAPVDPPTELPTGFYDINGTYQPLVPQRQRLSETWADSGYTKYKKFLLLDNQIAQDPLLSLMVAADGPIFFAGGPENNDKYPVDTWGNPYIFESSYQGTRLYSLGPNGVPGNNMNPTHDSFFSPTLRPQGVLGTQDDLVLEF